MMHWILQNNMFHEIGMQELRDYLERIGISYSEHKVIPFIGELQPDVYPDGNVFCVGSYSMRHVAKKRGWTPGVIEVADYRECIKQWGEYHMLNGDAGFMPFRNCQWLKGAATEEIFIRPVSDTKYFAGTVMEIGEIKDWAHKVCELGEDDGTSLRGDTMVMIVEPKTIYREWRFWVVDNFVVTSSQYKQGSRVIYKSENETDNNALKYAIHMASSWNWQPARAYVLDICETINGYFVVEVNNINSAGLYAANVPKLVDALESMKI